MTCPGLTKIDLILAIAGHQITPSKKWHKIMRPFLFLLCFCRMITVLIIDLKHYSKLSKITIYHISDTMFTTCAIVFHLTAGLKHSSISRFITKYKSLMTHEYKDRLEVVGRRNLAFHCLFFVIQYLLLVCYERPLGVCEWTASHTFMDRHDISLLKAIVIRAALVYECLVYQCWMVMCFCLFNYSLTVKQEAIHCKLNHLYVLIMNRDSGSSRQLESPVITFMQAIQEEFDSCFSIFPFLVFAANFMQTSGYLLSMINSTDTEVFYKIFQVLISLSFLTVSLFMSLTASFRRK